MVAFIAHISQVNSTYITIHPLVNNMGKLQAGHSLQLNFYNQFKKSESFT